MLDSVESVIQFSELKILPLRVEVSGETCPQIPGNDGAQTSRQAKTAAYVTVCAR